MNCGCNYDFEAQWYFEEPDSYSVMPVRKRRVRCSSCKKLIEPGSTVNAYDRSRSPKDDIEIRIYGEDWDSVPLSPMYHCEECADLYWSLADLGYCVSITEPLKNQVAEFNALKAERK